MSLIPSNLTTGKTRSLAAVGLEPSYPPLRRTPEGHIDFDWYLLRARRARADAYGRALGALWHGLRAAYSNRIRARRERLAHRRAVAELLALDDRSLHDLGLGRSSVHYAVDHGRENIPAPANVNMPTSTPRAA
jgi:uncharacterized protein YjiS (DUF1127 family)